MGGGGVDLTELRKLPLSAEGGWLSNGSIFIMSMTRRRLLASAFAGVPVSLLTVPGRAQEVLSKPRELRLQQLLPRTYAKLMRRAAVHVAVCGDDISRFNQPDPALRHKVTMAWPSQFLDHIGGFFHYHAGVMAVNMRQKPEEGLDKDWAEWLLRLATQKKKGEGGADVALPGPLGEQTRGGQILLVNDLMRLGIPPKLQTGPIDQLPGGAVFMLRDFSREGATAIQLLDPLTCEVFLTKETDLVFLCCGARDASAADPLTSFRKALTEAVSLCRDRGVDVILGGPPPALDEPDDRRAIGRTRPYASVMREVAEKAGVFFADTAAALIRRPADLLQRTEEAAFTAALEPVRRCFVHGPEASNEFTPNAAAHRQAGQVTAQWLLDGEPTSFLSMKGFMTPVADGNVEMTLQVLNRGETPANFVLCPLHVAGWTVTARGSEGALDPFFTLPSAKQRSFVFKAEPDLGGSRAAGDEDFARGCALLVTDDVQMLVDLRLQIQPVALLLEEQRLDGVSGELLLKPAFANNSSEPRVGEVVAEWRGRQLPPVPLTIPPASQVVVPLRLPVPDAGGKEPRFVESLVLNYKSSVGEQSFTTEISGVRHLGLDSRIALTGGGGAAPVARISADLHGFYLSIAVPSSLSGPPVASKRYATLELQVDGRGTQENGTLGNIGKIVADYPREDAEVKVRTVRPAALGKGYALDPEKLGPYFRPSVTTRANGDRELVFNFSRQLLTLHEWSLDGSGQNTVGLNIRLILYSTTGNQVFTLCASNFPHADGRSLTLVELTTRPSDRWSVRVG